MIQHGRILVRALVYKAVLGDPGSGTSILKANDQISLSKGKLLQIKNTRLLDSRRAGPVTPDPWPPEDVLG